MSEEENKAIETLKEVASDDFDTLGDDISPKMAQNILNLIENQQKEIEREKQYTNFYEDLCNKQQKEIEENQVLIDDIKEHRIVYIDIPEFEEKFISKDKVRKKIEEIKTKTIGASTGIYAIQIDILEELLEE